MHAKIKYDRTYLQYIKYNVKGVIPFSEFLENTPTLLLVMCGRLLVCYYIGSPLDNQTSNGMTD